MKRRADLRRLRHVAITGYYGAGKTRLVRRLAAQEGVRTLAIDDVDGDWREFRRRALGDPGPLILESVALPRWPLAMLIYCRCQEPERQRRLQARPAATRRPADSYYDYSQIAELVVDTTGEPELEPIVARIRRALLTRPARRRR